MNRVRRLLGLSSLFLVAACAAQLQGTQFTPSGSFGEHTAVLHPAPGVTATVVAPLKLDRRKRVDLILYALPNGNTTAQTMGRRKTEGLDWHFDIQHIAAQTRALRGRGITQAVVAYLENDIKSWPAWRSRMGYDSANGRIVKIVDSVRAALGNPPHLTVTLTGHSGGGSFAWGFIDGQPQLPDWLERIAFLDSNYSFEPRHGDKITEWLRRNRRNTVVVLGYDDREITLDGKKVVSDSGGTWRASHRMMENLNAAFPLTEGREGDFIQFRNDQLIFLLHPNPQNRILHTEMIGEMNGYMHAMLLRRQGYSSAGSLLRPSREYTAWVEQ